MFKNLMLIGIGSFAGGISRFLCQQAIQKYYPSYLPLGTLMVNITGCFLIGIIYGLATKSNLLSPEFRLLAATGFCGGYTTFSSFAFENISMMQDGEFFNTALYILLSLIIGFAAVYTGIFLTKLI